MQSRTSRILFTQELSSVFRLPHKDLGPGLAEGDVQQRLLPPAAHQMDGLGGRRQGQLPLMLETKVKRRFAKISHTRRGGLFRMLSSDRCPLR